MMSRKAAKSHDECRLIVCFGCGKSPVTKRLGPSGQTLVDRFDVWSGVLDSLMAKIDNIIRKLAKLYPNII